MFLVGAAKVFGWLMTNLQIPHMIGEAIIQFTSSGIVFLLIMNVLLLVLGTLVNASAAVVILTPIFLPVALNMGIDPIHFGVIMVVNLAIGCITPSGRAGSVRGQCHYQGALGKGHEIDRPLSGRPDRRLAADHDD